MNVTVGDPIPLILQLFDGKDNYKPVAILFDDSGDQIAEIPLVHFGRGLYLDKSIPMPEGVRLIIAQYHVRDLDGRPVDDYELVTDIFNAVQKQKAPEKRMIGQIVGESSLAGIGRIFDEAPNS